MTLDGFPLFVYSVKFCQPELATRLMMGSNPDLALALNGKRLLFFGPASFTFSPSRWVTFD